MFVFDSFWVENGGVMCDIFCGFFLEKINKI